MSEKNTTSDGGDGNGNGNGNIIYSVGEKVLAYHGPRIYQAIVQRAEIRKNEWNYFVHYIDSSESSDEWVGIERLLKYTEENIVKLQALDENLLVNDIKWLLNSKSGCSTQPEVLNDVKVEKEDVNSSGAKGKRKEGDSRIEEDEDCPGRDMIDFISQMPDDVLVKILSLLPLKHAVTTCILSTRWRFVWSYLKSLDFDGSESLERAMYINQVNSVIGSHRNPVIEFFRICFDLDNTCSEDIDNWLRFAFDKKVEVLQLDFSENGLNTEGNYDFPLPLSDGNVVRYSEWPLSCSMAVKTLSLEKLFLLRVNVSDLALSELLKNSPHLETLLIYGSGLLSGVNIGGRDINLKNFVLMCCPQLQSVSLNDFDLEKFHYIGRDIHMCLKNLPKIKEVDIGRVSVGLNNKVFSSISSIASHLEGLSLHIDRRLEDLKIDAIPVLPNVKRLTLTLPTQHRDCLLEFIEIAKACPILETFIISLYWCSPNTRTKPWSDAIGHSFPRLNHFEIGGYCGQLSDFQVALYMIGNAAGSLKKIVIDPSCHPNDVDVLTPEESMMREDAGRSHAKSELSSCVPPWVELAIL